MFSFFRKVNIEFKNFMKEFKELKSELFKINKTLKEVKGINHSSLMTNIINIADIKKRG